MQHSYRNVEPQQTKLRITHTQQEMFPSSRRMELHHPQGARLTIRRLYPNQFLMARCACTTFACFDLFEIALKDGVTRRFVIDATFVFHTRDEIPLKMIL